MGWVQGMTLSNGVETKTFGPALRINDEPAGINRRPPELGEHTDEVLAEIQARKA